MNIANVLNMHFYISSSKIAEGKKGLFSGRILKAGTIILKAYTRVDTKGKSFDEDYLPAPLIEWIQHQEQPNLKVLEVSKEIHVETKGNIEKGAELSINYNHLLEVVRTLGYEWKIPEQPQ